MTSPDYEDIRKRLARPRPEPKLITMQGYWTLSGDGAHGTGPPPLTQKKKHSPPPVLPPPASPAQWVRAHWTAAVRMGDTVARGVNVTSVTKILSAV